MIKAVQQFQLREEFKSEEDVHKVLELMKAAGYDGIELNGFMIDEMPFIVRMLTRLAGMPVGKSGKFNWEKLVKESGLKVVSLHMDLGSILKRPDEVVAKVKAFNTKYVVVTGMHNFDYTDKEAVLKLSYDLNEGGEVLKKSGLYLLYHNHNTEFRRIDKSTTAFDLLFEHTNPEFVNFEFDSFWAAETGVDVISLMEKLGNRIKLYHVNDRGCRKQGKGASIVKSDSMELGLGNMNLNAMIEIVKKNDVEAIVLETHKNWIDNSAVKSMQLSAEYLNKHV